MASIHFSDTLYVYDGPDANAPLLGAYNNFTNPVLALLPVQATLNNPSGCLTIRFVSGSTNEANGFHASITCEHLCQDVIAELDMSLTNPTPDTNYIAICPGTEIDFSANASFPQNNILYNQSEATTDFLWVFGDGTTATGENVSHTYNNIGGYTVSLFATDIEGCVSSNSIDTRVVIAGNPYSNSNPPAPICANDTLVMDFDMLGIGGTIVEGTPYHEEITTTLGVTDTLSLPDGTGVCYESSVVFNCFEPEQTLDNPQDFINLTASLEHSFIGDLEISLICPNGQSLVLKSFTDDGGGTGYGGGTALGEPDENDDGVPGIGWNYSWTPISPTYTNMGNEAENGMDPIESNSFEPYGTFYDLVGCPLNGQWTIEICDNWGADDGTIFGWEMTLNPDIAPDSWDYTVPIDQYSWANGPHIIDQSDESITVNPPATGTYNYTYNIIDHYGCSWDTTIAVTVLNSPTVDLGPDLTFCPGVNSHVFNAMNAGNSYTWQDNATSQTYNATVPGTYSVTVSNGLCEAFDEAIIYPHSGFTVTETHTNVSCFEGNDGTITINATSDYPPYFFNWPDGQTSNQATNLTIGDYEVTITDNNGCQTTESVNISQPTLLTASYTSNVISCYGGDDGAIDLSVSGGTPPYSFLWSNGSTEEDVDTLIAGTYSVQIQDANLCSIYLNVSIEQAGEIATALPDEHYYCSEFAETLHTSTTGGAAPYAYLWSTGETSESINISPKETTTYRVTIIDSHGCTITNNAKVLVYPDLDLIVSVKEDSVCMGNTSQIGIEVTGGSGQYTSYLNGLGTGFPVEVNPLDANLYTVEVRDNCFHSTSQQVEVYNYPSPSVEFSSDIIEGCPPLNVQFNYASDCDNCIFLWEFSNDINTPNTAIEMNPTHTFESGIYDVSLKVENEFGCISTITKHRNIYAYPKPIAQFKTSTNTTSIIAPNINFSNYSENAVTYEWSFGDSQTSEGINPLHNYKSVGHYNVQLTAISRDGCKDTETLLIKVNDELTFYAPEAFTPNADGNNESFRIYGNGIENHDFTLRVFNRWGEQIFVSQKLDDGWNGRYSNSGNLCSPGYYTWVCSFVDIYGVEHEKSGVITLIR
jgi:gliding motility-associated-like protein